MSNSFYSNSSSVILADVVYTNFDNGMIATPLKMFIKQKRGDIENIPTISLNDGIIKDRKLLQKLINDEISYDEVRNITFYAGTPRTPPF